MMSDIVPEESHHQLILLATSRGSKLLVGERGVEDLIHRGVVSDGFSQCVLKSRQLNASLSLSLCLEVVLRILLSRYSLLGIIRLIHRRRLHS